MADAEGAARLKQVLKIAMANLPPDDEGNAWTWNRLAIRSGVSPTTIENWIYGRTQPRANELAKVAAVLRPWTSQAKLESAYAGIAPEEPPLIEVLRELAPDLHELVVLLRAQADEAVLQSVRAALLERHQRRVVEDVEPGPPDEP